MLWPAGIDPVAPAPGGCDRPGNGVFTPAPPGSPADKVVGAVLICGEVFCRPATRQLYRWITVIYQYARWQGGIGSDISVVFSIAAPALECGAWPSALGAECRTQVVYYDTLRDQSVGLVVLVVGSIVATPFGCVCPLICSAVVQTEIVYQQRIRRRSVGWQVKVVFSIKPETSVDEIQSPIFSTSG